MSTQFDVKAVEVAGGNSGASASVAYRARLKGVAIGNPVAGGQVVIKDGNGGTTLFSFTAPAAAGGINIVIPGEGILFSTSINVTTAAGQPVTIFYG